MKAVYKKSSLKGGGNHRFVFWYNVYFKCVQRAKEDQCELRVDYHLNFNMKVFESFQVT